jgi:glyoxylase-like metal-dependent hydrolase (beta-lactamase superfamily II)
MYGATVDVDDATLRALGISRLEIPVPFLEAGGPANVYAIEDADGGLTLFDTGIGTPDGLAALRGQAAAKGLDLTRLSKIVVSHGHVDHFGNAQQLAEGSGASVHVHPADFDKVLGHARYSTLLRKHWAYFLRLGIPVEVLEQMQALAERSSSAIRYVDAHRLVGLAEGQVLEFRHFQATVKHMPGHTPGLVCLYAEAEGIFFADDHVLARVSPNPVLDFSQGEGPTKFRALCRYLEGAKWVRDLDLAAVLPGHGPAFSGHRELLDGLFEFYERRQAKMVARLLASPASVYELVEAIFPRRDFGRLVLMVSEIIANLEVLEDQGKVRVVERWADVERYQAVT